LEDYNVIIELTAKRDLQGILHYIKNILRAPEAAKRIYIKIKNEILTLNQMPMRNNAVQEQPYASMGLHKLLVENYIVFYIIDEQKHEVHVLRILYNRREWQSIL
jgi:toxin ParE1/3/4